MAKKIFLSCTSGESTKDLAEIIAQHLAEKGYNPIRWWEEFRPGDYTFERLMKIANQVDGAVFLFTGDDKLMQGQNLTSVPRDNVVLESGIFVAKLGKKFTYLLKDKDTKLPSDFDGITIAENVGDKSTVAKRTTAYFTEAFAQVNWPTSEAITLIADPDVVSHMTAETTPPHWHQRNLYLGIEGAKGWLSVVNEASYAPRHHERKILSEIIKAVEDLEVRTFVSLGPGDGQLDREIAYHLQKKEPWLRYIPVDISDGLLHRAVSVLSDHVRIPMGILGDFEDGLGFIFRQLRLYGRPPMILALLGNTIGNLDNFEKAFLDAVSIRITTEDYLLLEVSLMGKEWSFKDDRRAMHSTYDLANRRFIATALARRSGESIDQILLSFEDRIEFTNERSDVPCAQTIELRDSRTRSHILSIRRYHWEELLRWLDKNMNFVIQYAKPVFSDDKIGDGILLLKRKKPL